jgi:hypothetical protein
MAKRHKKTPTERAYSKQVRRIKQFISRAEKTWISFQRKYITKKDLTVSHKPVLENWQKLTPDKLERSARANKGAETKKYKLAHPTQEPTNTKGFIPPENISEDTSFFDAVVISGFKAHVRQFNEHASNLLLSWLDKILATNDVHDVATMLNDGAEAGLIVTYQIVYSQDKLTQYMSEMLDYLPEAGELFKAEMMDAMEEEEDYSSPL